MVRSSLILLLLVLLPVRAWATCAAVASATASFSTSANTTKSITITAGDTVVVSMVATLFGTPGPGAWGNVSNSSFTPDAIASMDSNGCYVYTYHLFNAPSGLTSITAGNGGDGGAYTIFDFNGSSNVVDKVVNNGGNSASTTGWLTPLSGTLSQAAEMAMGVAGGCAGATMSGSPSNGYTEIGGNTTTAGSNGDSLISGYLVTAATTSTQTKYTITGGEPYSAVTTTYECTGGGAATSTQKGFFIPLDYFSRYVNHGIYKTGWEPDALPFN